MCHVVSRRVVSFKCAKKEAVTTQYRRANEGGEAAVCNCNCRRILLCRRVTKVFEDVSNAGRESLCMHATVTTQYRRAITTQYRRAIEGGEAAVCNCKCVATKVFKDVSNAGRESLCMHAAVTTQYLRAIEGGEAAVCLFQCRCILLCRRCRVRGRSIARGDGHCVEQVQRRKVPIVCDSRRWNSHQGQTWHADER